MQFSLNINLNGAAFHDGRDQDEFAPEYELSRLLNVASKHVRDCFDSGTLIDANGHAVGSFMITEDEAPEVAEARERVRAYLLEVDRNVAIPADVIHTFRDVDLLRDDLRILLGLPEGK